MDNVQEQAQEAQVTPPQSTSFSVEPRNKNNGSKWILIFIGLLILGGAGIFFFTKSSNEPIVTPTPSFNVTPIEDSTTSTPTNSPAPVKKSEVSIEIQNGTGITGEAKFLQDKLKVLGYSDITAGNADRTDYTETVVTFSKALSQTVQDEIKKELEKIYEKVSVKTSSTQKSDVVIITGSRAGQTSKPVSSATAKPSASASSSASPTASTTPAATSN